MKKTTEQYHAVVAQCQDLFLKKARDYGTSWRILRMPSITDQIYIKAERIRSIQEKKKNEVGDAIEGEFMAIVNYCVIALMLLERRGKDTLTEPAWEELKITYEKHIATAFGTMEKKNHDYGEAWRSMRISSMTDLILVKLLRLKQMEDNVGTLLVSEGPEGNYIDMLNYAVFCLIRISEGADSLK